jgi:outer membrane lipoprotein-sorting protein
MVPFCSRVASAAHQAVKQYTDETVARLPEAECARPRAQQCESVKKHRKTEPPQADRNVLRPGTGALQCRKSRRLGANTCPRLTLLIPVAALWLTIAPAFAQTSDNQALLGWLAAQTNIQTWSADFVQTRNLASLTQPLTATGRVWFAAPNQFRWELGHPARTIAVREPDQLLVIYPRLKRVERYPLDSRQAGPWKDTLALLDAGFPRSQAEVESRFNILSQRAVDGADELALQPKAGAARHFMPKITIGFDAASFSLLSTELQFSDGSTMRNVFTNAVMNPKLDPSLFKPAIEPDWKITEPLTPSGSSNAR